MSCLARPMELRIRDRSLPADQGTSATDLQSSRPVSNRLSPYVFRFPQADVQNTICFRKPRRTRR